MKINYNKYKNEMVIEYIQLIDRDRGFIIFNLIFFNWKIIQTVVFRYRYLF